MTYITCTQTGSTLDNFEKVDAALGPQVPTGLVARYVGTNEHGFCVTAIWSSKADSDRFTAERLFPALREVFGELPGDPMAAISFEAVDELVIEVAR